MPQICVLYTYMYGLWFCVEDMHMLFLCICRRTLRQKHINSVKYKLLRANQIVYHFDV